MNMPLEEGKGAPRSHKYIKGSSPLFTPKCGGDVMAHIMKICMSL